MKDNLKELFILICESLYIPQIVDWISRKIQ